MGLIVGISSAHLVLPWGVLAGWGRCAQLQMGLAVCVPRTHRGFSMRHRSFSCRREVGGCACHTSSHTRGCAVTHGVARGVTAQCAQPVRTRTHVQGAMCTRVWRSRRCSGSARHAATRVLRCVALRYPRRPAHGGAHSASLTRASPPPPGPFFGARLAAPGGAGAGPAY